MRIAYLSLTTEWEGKEKMRPDSLLKGAQWKEESKLTQARTWEILTIKKPLFIMRVSKYWKRLSRRVAQSLPLGVLEFQTGHSPERLDEVEPALNKRLDEMNDNGSLQLLIL